jgi:flagellar hook assembly protein FlgD
MPTEVKINSVSPNPLNRGNASIDFGLPTDSQARLEIIDALGNVVTTLVSDVYNAGFHSVQWDGRDVNGVDLPSGTYTCRLVAGGASSAYPFVIIK